MTNLPLLSRRAFLCAALLSLLPVCRAAAGDGGQPSMTQEQYESELQQIVDGMQPTGDKRFDRMQTQLAQQTLKSLKDIPEDQRERALQDLQTVATYMKTLAGDGDLSPAEKRQMFQTFGAAIRDRPGAVKDQMAHQVAEAYDRILDASPGMRVALLKDMARQGFGKSSRGEGRGQGPSPEAWTAANQAAGGKSPSILDGLAKSMLGVDDAGALEAAKQAISLGGDNAEPHAIAAQALYNMNDYKGAAEAAREALRLDPGNGQATAIERLTAGRGGPETAGPRAEAPAQPVGDRFFGMGGGGPSARTPAPAPGPGPRNVSGFLMDARLRLKQGDPAAALEAARRALAADGRSQDARYFELMALIRLRRAEEAVQAAGEALKLSPSDPRLLTARANAYNLLKEYDLALKDARAAMAIDPGIAEAHANAAWALDGLGRREEARRELFAAARLNPRQFGPLLEKAKALQDGELAALLAGEGGAPGPGKEPGPKPAFLTGRRAATMGLAMLAGAVLIVWGLLQLGTTEWKERLAGLFSGRRSPEVEDFSAERPPAGEDPTGRRIAGSYQVVRKLGVGGMGVVYEGMDTALGRRVAVKRMRDDIRLDPEKREGFLKEARMVAALRHPNIVDIYQIVEEGPDAYLVFEYVDGKTLRDVLAERGRLSFEEAMGVVSGASAALEYAHGREVVHRDLKPANIMVNRDRQIKLMDFGVARQARDSLGRTTVDESIVGTPPYMAPEQDQGAACRATDVYALGVCLYEMVTGKCPFSGSAAGMALAKAKKTYTPASGSAAGLPPGFDAVLDKALEPDPAKRWQSARELYAALKSLPRV